MRAHVIYIIVHGSVQRDRGQAGQLRPGDGSCRWGAVGSQLARGLGREAGKRRQGVCRRWRWRPPHLTRRGGGRVVPPRHPPWHPPTAPPRPTPTPATCSQTCLRPAGPSGSFPSWEMVGPRSAGPVKLGPNAHKGAGGVSCWAHTLLPPHQRHFPGEEMHMREVGMAFKSLALPHPACNPARAGVGGGASAGGALVCSRAGGSHAARESLHATRRRPALLSRSRSDLCHHPARGRARRQGAARPPRGE